MRTCKECGSQNNSRVKFCTTCGSILDDDEEILDDTEHVSVNDSVRKSVDSVDDLMDESFHETKKEEPILDKREQKRREKEAKKEEKRKEKERKREEKERLKEEKRRAQLEREAEKDAARDAARESNSSDYDGESKLVYILVPVLFCIVTIVMLVLMLLEVNEIFKILFPIFLVCTIVVSAALWLVYQYKHRTVLTDSYLEGQKDSYKLILTYIGDNYDKILEKGFSWPAFLFGPFYLMYRKKYFLGIIVLIVLDLVVFYVCTLKWYVLGVIFYLLGVFILGLFFNGIYLSSAKKKIDNIKLEFVNFIDMEAAARKRGGVNIVLLIIMAIALGIAVFFEYDHIARNLRCTKEKIDLNEEYKDYVKDVEVHTVPSDPKMIEVEVENISDVNFITVEFKVLLSDNNQNLVSTCSQKISLSAKEKKLIRKIKCDQSTDKAEGYDFEVVSVRVEGITTKVIENCK